MRGSLQGSESCATLPGMATELTIAVVGPAGLVGREILELLGQRQFPAGSIRLLGTHRTAGAEVELAGRKEKIALLTPQAFDGVELAFFAAGPGVAGEHAPRAAAAGAAVIDVSSRFRLDPEIPLVVPEVNVGKLGEWGERGIVASPSGTATALGVVLGALAEAGLRRVVVSSYQGVASAGRRAVGALSQETIDLLNARGVRRRPRFARRIAFNCVPQVGALEPGGSTTHELLVVEELRKLLDLPGLGMSVTAIRVPIFFGSAFSVNLETESPLGAAGATAILQRAPGILLHDEPGGSYPTPAEVAGSDATHVGRVRDDPSAEPPGLMLWIALDNVRKGAALNAVQIAEILARDHL